MCEMRVIRDDPLAPSLVISNYAKFRAGLAAEAAAMDAAVRETAKREAMFPLLRTVRECRIMNRRTRDMFYERARDAAMWARIERRLQAERDRRAEQERGR